MKDLASIDALSTFDTYFNHMIDHQTKKKILIIDDDLELCTLLIEYLTPIGFSVSAENSGLPGSEKALSDDFDLVILDVMLPGENGFDILRRIRSQSNIPILMLTARGEDIDKVVGLELGADDYISKPFNSRELLARIRTNLRKDDNDHSENKSRKRPLKITIGDIEMDAGTRTVRKSNNPIGLTSVEYNLLELLLISAGQIVLREELIRYALGRESNPFDRSLDVHISSIRKKIGHKIGNNDRIITIRGIGYLYSDTTPKDPSSL